MVCRFCTWPKHLVAILLGVAHTPASAGTIRVATWQNWLESNSRICEGQDCLSEPGGDARFLAGRRRWAARTKSVTRSLTGMVARDTAGGQDQVWYSQEGWTGGRAGRR